MSIKNSSLAKICGVLLSIFLILSESTPFSPIEVGTFQITMRDLQGLNKKTTKQIEVKTPWSVFNENLNIKVICVISSIDIEERVSLQWDCNLADRILNEATGQKRKIVEVQIRHKNNYIYENLRIGVNYFIAQNLRTGNYNITDFQQHLENQPLTDQQTNPSNKMVHNELFLFPNGFSSINLTHHIMYSYITPPDDMYTIHYMTNMEGEHDKQGWVEGRDFIYQRWVWFPKWQFGYNACSTVYESMLENDFYFNCTKGGVDGYFFGFMGYSGHKFIGHFQTTRNGFSFKIEYADKGSMYNVLAIPYKLSEKFTFIDNRIHPYDYVQEKSFLKYLIAAIALLILIPLILVILRKKKILYFDLQEEKVPQITSEASDFQTKKGKNSQNKKSKHDKAPYSTYEDEMKQQPFQHSEVRSEFDKKEDNFTLE